MRTLATGVLVVIVVIASLACLLSSLCTVSSGLELSGDQVTAADRLWYALCALVSLGIAVGGSMLIGKINRKQ